MAAIQGDRPNLVVVVLDCARAASFPGTGGPPGSFPFLEGRRAECTVFTRASTVAPWTLPAHASLFTGRYPWEHGVMGEGGMEFDPTVPMVAGILQRAGYDTLALSANGLIAPLLGYTGSFAEYRSAEWWERTLRWIPPETMPGRPDDRPFGMATLLSLLRHGVPPGPSRTLPEAFLLSGPSSPPLQEAVRKAVARVVRLDSRADTLSWAAADLLNRGARFLSRPEAPGPLPVAPWIGPTLERWLRRRPIERPVHCFVNLLDLHEKYLSDREVLPSIRSWIRFVQIPQNARLWLQGAGRPTAAELEVLRWLYDAVVRSLDRRLEELVRVLQRTGRWDDTLLVVTSDHGQAFGDHGQVFHGRSPFQALLHIPLWIRWPHGRGGGQIRQDPVSLVDVAPTLLAAAGLAMPAGLSGVPLQGEPPRSRPVPVLAMADGYPSLFPTSNEGSGRGGHSTGQLQTVAYSGRWKVIYDAESQAVRVFDLDADPNEGSDRGAQPDGDGARAEAAARDVSARILGKGRRPPTDRTLQERLQTWGYL